MVMGVVVGLVLLGAGLWVRGQIVQSQIVGQNYRYSMVIAGSEGDVEYVSYDPEEKRIMVISWPKKLAINSRSVGSYQVEDLYELGSYDGKPGEFVRQKVQGYMKTPIMSYIEVEGFLGGLKKSLLRMIWYGSKVSEMSRLDGLILLGRTISYDVKRIEIEELVRTGVLKECEEIGYEYQEGRLQQFLGKRIFDWGVGGEELGVVVINQSQAPKLASDVARFFENTGLAVIAVRSGDKKEDKTKVIMTSELSEEQQERVRKMLYAWFGWEKIEMGNTSEYRAEIVVELGKDAEDLF